MTKHEIDYLLESASSLRNHVREQTGAILKDEQIGNITSDCALFSVAARFDFVSTVSEEVFHGGIDAIEADLFASDEGSYRTLVAQCADEEETYDENIAALFNIIKAEGFTLQGEARTVRNCRRRIFFQYDCSSCAGHGELNCGTCGSAGKVQCPYCYGFTKVTCPSCNGSRGRHYEEHYYSAGRPQISRKWQACVLCFGTGKADCRQCSFGEATCGNCAGSGTLRCGGCSGYRFFTKMSEITVTAPPEYRWQVEPAYEAHPLIKTYLTHSTYPGLASISKISLVDSASIERGMEFNYRGVLRECSFTVSAEGVLDFVFIDIVRLG